MCANCKLSVVIFYVIRFITIIRNPRKLVKCFYPNNNERLMQQYQNNFHALLYSSTKNKIRILFLNKKMPEDDFRSLAFLIPTRNFCIIRTFYFSIFTICRYSVIFPEEIFRMYIPGARVLRWFRVMVFPPPATIILLVFRIRSPVREIRLISKLPDKLLSTNILTASLNGLGKARRLVLL